ncbi:MAG: excinuclease ABC subunit UvrA [Planctomycetota bacterium]|jgi:excinuclease ABC subunit A
MSSSIVIRGAAENNLRNVDLEIPRNRLVVITGLSGSGKSTLADDIICREGQRRFVESLSAYARQYLGRLDRPRVEHIEGLSPTISIDQKTISRNPRSTVGTITEILDHLRLLYARLGTPHCPRCDAVIESHSVDRIVEEAYLDWTGRSITVCAPIVLERKGEYRKELAELRDQGFVRVRIDGEIRRLDEEISLARYERHTIEVVYDRVKLTPDRRTRFSESVEKAVALGEGLVRLLVDDEDHLISSRFSCPSCRVSLPELEPRLFSFNSTQGACERCHGLGRARLAELDAVIPDPDLSLSEGAIALPRKGRSYAHIGLTPAALIERVEEWGGDGETPWRKLKPTVRRRLWSGESGGSVTRGRKRRHGVRPGSDFPGLAPLLEEAFATTGAWELMKFLPHRPCPRCEGSRLRPEVLAVRFRERSIHEIVSLTVDEALALFGSLELDDRESAIGKTLFPEIIERLQFLEHVGLGYLSLARSADTLSGGEAQRIRLAGQLGSGLRGVLYVLDEPSIGLHPRDNTALLELLRKLRDKGNSVLVVEHDRETIEAADHVIDVGPGAGVEGGMIVAEGSVTAIRRAPESITGRYLSGRTRIEVPAERRVPGRQKLVVRKAAMHNLKKIDVTFPLGVLTAVTGVSGSGKSTLVQRVLEPAVAAHLGLNTEPAGEHEKILGLQHLDRIIRIDQSPIGRTPRSNPGTYTKVFDEIRDLYASTPEAKTRGYRKGRFSFNVKGGRCEHCGGGGRITIDMQFLASVEVTCEECEGRRYNPETLTVKWRGRSISDVLEMPIAEACEFFTDLPKIHATLQTLVDVGLGYVRIGQPSTTLSGGEAQRVKLASELRKTATGRTLYVLDEPTTGLHFADVARLLECLQRLVDQGNSVIVIEHNLDVVKCADWVIDLGPEGGAGGGRVVAEGTPEAVAAAGVGATAAPLADALADRHAPPLRKGRKRGAGTEPEDRFVITGAREHNLKNLTVEVPRGSMTVVTGPSGSGKTTLAFDILFAEGQRRYVESLSTYARRFLGRLDRPDVDRVEGIAPAIAIDQSGRGGGPRSTVATSTELHDYLRLLFARAGTPHCLTCDAELEATTPTTAARRIAEELGEEATYILAPVRAAGAERAPLAAELAAEGFARIVRDGVETRLDEVDEDADLEGAELVIDRLRPAKVGRGRLAESVEEAYRRGDGEIIARTRGGEHELRFSERPSCPEGHGTLFAPLSPRLFSFNHHSGACPECQGIGHQRDLDPELLFTDPGFPLFEGAMEHRVGSWIGRKSGRVRKAIDWLRERSRVSRSTPVSEYPASLLAEILDGTGEEVIPITYRSMRGTGRPRRVTGTTWEGLRACVRRWHLRASSDNWRSSLEERMSSQPCPACGGGRLRPELLAVRVGGEGIADIARRSVREALSFFNELRLEGRGQKVVEGVHEEIVGRLRFLEAVGLGYLGLDRATETLSGGESQRIRLATQIGSHLVGVLYVLDEPTIGLHPRDCDRLLDSLTSLRDHGNSLVVVEHDEGTMERADHIIDLGPEAGRHGGRIVSCGTPDEVRADPASGTGRYLAGIERVGTPESRRAGDGGALEIIGARANNLRDVDIHIPTGTLTVFSGVSGSGKSSAVMDILARGLARSLHDARTPAGPHRELRGAEAFESLGVIDQTPLGRTPSSNAATYTGILAPIRTLFSRTPEARTRGWGPGRFSFNVAEGRCEECDGKGGILVEMHFLSDVWVECERCRGRRYNAETLKIRYKGLTIADVLGLEVSAARPLFENIPTVAPILDALEDVGLGYLPLGQSATTLSGGEAQRIQLAAELGRPPRGRKCYILDEPTTGLHFGDVRRLVRMLHRLVDRGDTVIVIEHDLDVIANADHVIDLGPEGGDGGGTIVAVGTPEEIAACDASHTGRYLRRRGTLLGRGDTAEAGGRSAIAR